MIRLLLIIVLFCLIQVQSQAPEQPNIQQERTGDTFRVFLVNPLYGPVSVHFDVTETNMSSRPGEHFDLVVTARSRVLAFTIKPSNPQRDWEFNFEHSWHPGDIYAVHNDSVVYDLPFEREKFFAVMQGYNGTFSHFGRYQYSIDFDMPVGTPVTAAREGTVIAVETSFSEGGRDPTLEANYITILHSDNTMADYLHLNQNGSLVRVGQKVERGEIIGYSGNVGYSTGPHLHFHVYRLADTSGNTRSLPVRFNFEGEAVELKEGYIYSRY